MAAEEQIQEIPEIPPQPMNVGDYIIYQSMLDNLHDFQSRGSKSQIRNSEHKVLSSFGFELTPTIQVAKVSGNERRIVSQIEMPSGGPPVVRNPPFTQENNGVIEVKVGIENEQLKANKGEKLLKEIAGITSEEPIPENYEFIFMFDACSELTYCFLENKNVYAIVTPEVIGDSAASSVNEQGYFKEDIMPETPNIECINPRRVIHFNSGIDHSEHLALGTKIQYGVSPGNELYKLSALDAYNNREKTSLDINKQFDIVIN